MDGSRTRTTPVSPAELHVATVIPVSDMARSREFYEQTLGLAGEAVPGRARPARRRRRAPLPPGERPLRRSGGVAPGLVPGGGSSRHRRRPRAPRRDAGGDGRRTSVADRRARHRRLRGHAHRVVPRPRRPGALRRPTRLIRVEGCGADESACKPDPVPTGPRGPVGGDHPSRPAVAGGLQRSTRRSRAGSPRTTCAAPRGRGTFLTLLRVGFTEPSWSPRTLVVSYTTVSPSPPGQNQELEPDGGLFSVALSRGSPRVAVGNHPALWSPDFPRRTLVGSDAVARPTRPRRRAYKDPDR